MKKLLFVAIPIIFTFTGCANRTNQQPLRAGIYGPIEYSIVVPEEKMVFGKHLLSNKKQELIRARNALNKLGKNIHVICPVSTTPDIMTELSNIGVIYDRDIRLQEGYLVIYPKINTR